jgi:hypothetical protein
VIFKENIKKQCIPVFIIKAVTIPYDIAVDTLSLHCIRERNFLSGFSVEPVQVPLLTVYS